mgnify:CR=1 FL=1
MPSKKIVNHKDFQKNDISLSNNGQQGVHGESNGDSSQTIARHKRMYLRRILKASFRPLSFSSMSSNAFVAEQLHLMKEEIPLVNEDDVVVGVSSKQGAHQLCENGSLLHRAFSVFLFNSQNELLLQQRSTHKITFPMLWTNTCCSHPLAVPTELEEHVGIKRAAIRKLEHELGIPCNVWKTDDFHMLLRLQYFATSCSTWAEHEIDHVLIARLPDNAFVRPNPSEVNAIHWLSQSSSQQWIKDHSHQTTPWFALIAANYLDSWWEQLRMDQLPPTSTTIIRHT